MSNRTFMRYRPELRPLMDPRDPYGKKSKKLITSKGSFSISIYAGILCCVMSMLKLAFVFIALGAMSSLAFLVISVILWVKETQEWLRKHP